MLYRTPEFIKITNSAAKKEQKLAFKSALKMKITCFAFMEHTYHSLNSYPISLQVQIESQQYGYR